MSTRLVILGMLREKPLYGYEIKHIIEEHMGDWTSIAFGSIYFALDKLAQEGMIDKVATEREGRRPSRSIYQITSQGRDEFLRLLRQVWQNIQHLYFDVDIALFFLNALPPDEIKGYLHKKVMHYEKALEYLEQHEKEQMQYEYVPQVAHDIFRHSKVHMAAELEWTRNLLSRLENGEI